MKTVNIDRLTYIVSKGKPEQLNLIQKKQIYEWAKEFEDTEKAELKRIYDQDFKKNTREFVDLLMLSMGYTLHFGLGFGQKRMDAFLKDLTTTIGMFRTGEYSPKEYVNALRDDKIKLDIDYEKFN